MLVILYQSGCEKFAQYTATDLEQAFAGAVIPHLVSAAAPGVWPADPAWDDLLVVFFKDPAFPAVGTEYVSKYLQTHRSAPSMLPIAVSPTARVPPKPIDNIKALQYDTDAPGENGRIVRRVGAMLSLRLQGRDAKIFLSHRGSDGAKIAKQLEAHLAKLGYRPWLDEARDIDGDTMITPGSDAQVAIDAALAEASLVLLLDTPDAPQSRWIKHEIDTADGLLLPILPIVFRPLSDNRKGPRFPSLLALQRWVDVPLPDTTVDSPLAAAGLDEIVHSAEQYLLDILRRKFRVPFVVQKEFELQGYSWEILDKRQLMYRSSKARGARLKTEVLNHCSIFDQIYLPALKTFRKFLEGKAWAQYPLFLYDGDLLSEQELRNIIELPDADRVIILHHQELAKLIGSNFTVLGAA